MFAFALATLALPLAALAAPAELATRASATYCGQYDSVSAGTYTLFLDQWGIGTGITGSDCATINSQASNVLSWNSKWSWTGGTGIKSYTNVQQNSGVKRQLSAIGTMSSFWKWTYSITSSSVANVAYDIFTASTSGGKAEYEIMVWLTNHNAGPISYNYNAAGNPVAIKSSITVAGYTWNLYKGSNGSNVVYSFLPTSGTLNTFNGDLKAFFTYLINNEGFSSAQYLNTFQAGTEATSGSGTFTTTYYTVSIK
ncbi:glycoside hydrolase family 12 protein [Peniophora sp. CONT]|nr:glycoside hydrolase family 12 protein [Peniophora sp. CONT]